MPVKSSGIDSPKRFVITGISDVRNNGCWAMADTTVRRLRRRYPEAIITIITSAATVKSALNRLDDVTVIAAPWTVIRLPKVRFVFAFLSAGLLMAGQVFSRRFRLNVVYPRFSRLLRNADLLVDLSGDSISTDYNDFSVFFQVIPAFLCKLGGAPYCFLAQSIGPFKRGWLYRWVRKTLNGAALITLRESISRELFEKETINAPVHRTGDIAFLMRPAPQSLLPGILRREGMPVKDNVIGVSLSSIIAEYMPGEEDRHNRYLKIMAKLLDALVEQHDMDVLMIPHVTIPDFDDRRVSRQVRDRMAHHARCRVLEQDYTADQLKRVFAACRVVITARMHAAIAAVSMKIPTLIIAYNHKSHGIFGRRLGLSSWIVDVRASGPDVWMERIRLLTARAIHDPRGFTAGLDEKLQAVCRESQRNFDLLAELLK